MIPNRPIEDQILIGYLVTLFQQWGFKEINPDWPLQIFEIIQRERTKAADDCYRRVHEVLDEHFTLPPPWPAQHNCPLVSRHDSAGASP